MYVNFAILHSVSLSLYRKIKKWALSIIAYGTQSNIMEGKIWFES